MWALYGTTWVFPVKYIYQEAQKLRIHTFTKTRLFQQCTCYIAASLLMGSAPYIIANIWVATGGQENALISS
jgi:hypothetical protein